MRRARPLLACLVIAASTSIASAQPQGACFFFQPNFQGQPMCIAPMQRLPSLSGPARGKIMSAQIPNGLRVTVCDNDNLGGTCATLTQPVPDFTALGPAGNVASIASDSGAPRAGAPQAAPQQGGYQPPPPNYQQPPQQRAYVPPSPPPQQQGGYQPPSQQGGYVPPSPPPPQQGGYQPQPQQGGYVPPSPPPQQQGGYQPQPQQGGYVPPSPPPRQQGSYQPSQQGGYQPPSAQPSGGGDANREQRRQLRRGCRQGDTNACTELGRLMSQRRPRSNGGAPGADEN